ncbi:MAG: hypothetical protein COS89_09820 [Deltaproteobacteria bacterium CG07_land_8_20_14_0_80_38_7]|nr:MAG: hypothetical protein COS89_09820 [Deltaproteobacteria bacterium CG07_land_8_20_14_0_80_38_7]
MAKPLNLLLGIHHHQPVGNFDKVFAEAFRKCYKPFLDLLEKYPDVKISLHHSGPLLDWALENEPDYLPKLVKLVKKGQIEIMGGGFYEPILPILKTDDAIGQIKMMQDFWKKHADFQPKGMWLAERVWEPSLASLLCDAGMKYTILDDEHFRHAGITDPTLLNYYTTERAGKTVAIFPSDQRLRYMIPFKQVDEVINHLLSLAAVAPGVGITYGDDGEKFGMWPGTHEWVIEKGWLDKFFSMLSENKDRIKTTTFSEFISENKPSNTIYLPTASYQEMLEWAMPADAIFRYRQAKEFLNKSGMWELASPFLRGGFFDNFLSKYPESNLMHKKMLYVSNKIDTAESKGIDIKEARKHLYKSQCNCAYWHGLFGGLYLNYLRHAIYENLLKAENILSKSSHADPVEYEIKDINFDQVNEIIVRTKKFQVLILPKNGGSIAELSYRPANFNLQNTLARRFEAYHRPVVHNENQGNNGISSIHDINKDLSLLGEKLIYDDHPAFSLLDCILPSDTNWKDARYNLNEKLVDFANLNYDLIKQDCNKNHANFTLESHGSINSKDKATILKTYKFSDNMLVVDYAITHTGEHPEKYLFATEINLSLLAGNDPHRYYKLETNQKQDKLSLDSKRSLNETAQIELVDEYFGFKLKITTEPMASWVWWPVETVSQSEKGFDHIYQGSKIWINWNADLTNNSKANFSIGFSLEPL